MGPIASPYGRSVRISISPSTSAISRCASGRAVSMAPRIQERSFAVTPGANRRPAARTSSLISAPDVEAAPASGRMRAPASTTTAQAAMTMRARMSRLHRRDRQER